MSNKKKVYAFSLCSLQFSPKFKSWKDLGDLEVSINDSTLFIKYFSIFRNSRELERNERNRG
jgi:hypothetical protein